MAYSRKRFFLIRLYERESESKKERESESEKERESEGEKERKRDRKSEDGW